MTDNHPITPPPELVEKWHSTSPLDRSVTVATQAARWGADQELEACCEWLGDAPVVWDNNGDLHPGSYLRDARRPKPASLKEQALKRLAEAELTLIVDPDKIIRRALEQLDD
jgi:hypothetical protein